MPRASKPVVERRRRKVAAAVVAGKKPRAIAKAVGVKKRQVQRIAAEPATRLLIADLMQPHHERLRKLSAKAVAAVGRALEAKTTRGRWVHEIQLRAVGRFADLAHLAQGSEKPGDDGAAGLVTWQQFIVLYQQKDKETHAA